VIEPSNTWVNVATKSGSTAEIMANFLVVRSALRKTLGESYYRERVVFTTNAEMGYLRQLAGREE